MRTLLAIVVLALAGCATYNQSGVEALNRGDLSTAERFFNEGVTRGDPMSINNVGVVYERRGNTSAAISHYTLAARLGVTLAAQNLARLGQPVPYADLAQERAQRAAAQSAATADFLRAIQPAPRPPTINCTSDRWGNQVQTTCR